MPCGDPPWSTGFYWGTTNPLNPFGWDQSGAFTTEPWKCKHCGGGMIGDGGPHYCPESWREAYRERLAEAVKLLESNGYTVTSPDSESGHLP